MKRDDKLKIASIINKAAASIIVHRNSNKKDEDNDKLQLCFEKLLEAKAWLLKGNE